MSCRASQDFAANKSLQAWDKCTPWTIGKESKHIIMALSHKKTDRSVQAEVCSTSRPSRPVPTTAWHEEPSLLSYQLFVTQCPLKLAFLLLSALQRLPALSSLHTWWGVCTGLQLALYRGHFQSKRHNAVVKGFKGVWGDNMSPAAVFFCGKETDNQVITKRELRVSLFYVV